jgi:hypothetical protein
MPSFELVKKLPCRPGPPASGVLQTLSDTFLCASQRCCVEQSLIGFGILYHGRCLTLYRKHDWTLAFSEELHEIAGTSAESSQRLNILSNVKHIPSSD